MRSTLFSAAFVILTLVSLFIAGNIRGVDGAVCSVSTVPRAEGTLSPNTYTPRVFTFPYSNRVMWFLSGNQIFEWDVDANGAGSSAATSRATDICGHQTCSMVFDARPGQNQVLVSDFLRRVVRVVSTVAPYTITDTIGSNTNPTPSTAGQHYPDGADTYTSQLAGMVQFGATDEIWYADVSKGYIASCSLIAPYPCTLSVGAQHQSAPKNGFGTGVSIGLPIAFSNFRGDVFYMHIFNEGVLRVLNRVTLEVFDLTPTYSPVNGILHAQLVYEPNEDVLLWTSRATPVRTPRYFDFETQTMGFITETIPSPDSPQGIWGQDGTGQYWIAGLSQFNPVNITYTQCPTPAPPPTPPTTTTQAPVTQPPTPTTPPGPECFCMGDVVADYKNTLVPDAARDAFTNITLDTDSWKVIFVISGVHGIANGHVIAGPVNSRLAVDAALAGSTQNYTAGDIWNPPTCGLGPIDTPASALGISASADFYCHRTYTIEYSLIDPAERTSHCQLTNTANDEILVECALQLNSIRAYDATEPTALLNKETVFRSNITMPRTLPNDLSAILHASLAKCSVYAAPEFYVDCRVPALWNFGTNFMVTQTPNWIIASSCTQTNGTDATYIRCDLQSISQIYTEVSATIGATVLPSGEQMNFAVNYSLPREETAVATGALDSFVKSIGTKDGKFYYGNGDLLTLEIEVVDTSRLQITQIDLFNSDVPSQSYDLRATPEFETVETQNATFFVITFYPARILRDSNFYRHGPHGVNVSFLFTAARRQQEGEAGAVTYSGIALKTPSAADGGEGAQNNGSSSATSVTVIAAAAAAGLIVVVAVAAVVVARGRSKSTAERSQKKATHVETEAVAAEDV